MILEKQTNAAILSDGEASQDSIQMGLDLDSAQILMQMLSKNLYSDAIGSTVREVASNALDSHRDVNSDRPIIVTFKANKDNNYEFSVEDFGSGLDDTEVRDIISKYGKSTRRNNANALGMMGLGFKAPLAYCSSFYFVTRKNGIERKYMMYEGEEMNMIDLLDERPTTLENGLKVIVPVEESDKDEFVEKIKEQLAYFDNVYFDVPSTSHRYEGYKWVGGVKGIENGFSIHRSEDFQISDLYGGKEMHICLDNVYYPIDFNKLKIPRIDIPIGLRFGLSDGLFPTPNREAIRYTEEAKKAIMKKISTVTDYFITRYNSTIQDTEDIRKIFDYYSDNERNVTIEGQEFNIAPIIKYGSIPVTTPKMIGIELLDLRRLASHSGVILNEYEVKYKLVNGRFSEYNPRRDNKYLTLDKTNKAYIFEERIGGVKKDYMRDTLSYGNTYYFVKKRPYSLFPKTPNDTLNYYGLLRLSAFPKSQWRQVIGEFQKIINILMSDCRNLDEVVIPEAWLEARKRTRYTVSEGGTTTRRVKLHGEVVGKLAMDLEKHTGNNSKFVPITYELAKICTKPYMIVYDTHDNASKLDFFYHVGKREKVKFVSFSEREIKVLSTLEIHNLIPLSKFMEGKTKPFRRAVTGYLIERLYQQNKNVFEKRAKLGEISTTLYNKLEELDKYRRAHYEYYSSENVYKAMLAIAEEHNYYDETIYPLYKEMKTLLDKFRFLENITKVMDHRNQDLIDVVRDMLKYHKFRLNYEKYGITINEEVKEEEKIEDDEEDESLKEDILNELANN